MVSSEEQPVTKSGLKTSEFWLAWLVPLIVALASLAGITWTPEIVAGFVAPIVAYILGRSWIKARETGF